MNYLFPGMRALHILMAALWLGSTVLMTFILMPAAEKSGPAGGQVMIAMNRAGMAKFFGIIGGVTSLTGLYLLWRFTGSAHENMILGIGGLAGILATILGGAVVGRSANKNVELMTKAGPMPDGPAKAALMQEGAALRQKMKTWGHVVLFLQLVAFVLMTLHLYI